MKGSQRSAKHSPSNKINENQCLDLFFTNFAHCSTYVKFLAIFFKKKQRINKNTLNLLCAQAISKAPNQSVTAKIFSATKYFDPPK